MAIPDRSSAIVLRKLESVSLPNSAWEWSFCAEQEALGEVIEGLARKNGLRCLGWRVVPTDPSIVGPRAHDTLPACDRGFFSPMKETHDLEKLCFASAKQVERGSP